MPTAILEDQGNTYRCGIYAAKQWFDGFGYDAGATPAFTKYCQLADVQKGLSFSQVNSAVKELSDQTKAAVLWNGDGYIHSFEDFDNAVKTGWCVIAGVLESDLNPNQNYYHYIDITGINGDNFTIVDSFHLYDGEDGQAPVEQVHKGTKDNWDNLVVGLAFKFGDVTPPPLSREDQLITILSVVGDKTYENPPDLAGIQELIQRAKSLYGA